MEKKNFWEEKTIYEMTPQEWEQLCDQCGKCCLHKIEDEDTGEIFLTNVACKLFDPKSCQCSNYRNRKKHVPDCTYLNPKNVQNAPWLPSTCAYKILASNGKLESWHPLLSGNKNTVHSSGNSLKGKFVIPEDQADDLRDHVVTWLD